MVMLSLGNTKQYFPLASPMYVSMVAGGPAPLPQESSPK